jgi:hypothetical protein
MSIFIGRGGSPEPPARAGNNQPRAIEVNRPYLFDNLEDSPLAMARGGAGQQGTNRVNGLTASANYAADIPPPKLQLKHGRSAAWNFREHHVVRKFNQLAEDELEKLSHTRED